MTKKLHVSIVTPEREVLDTEATQVIFPAHDGQVGVLVDRAPLLFALGIGEVRVDNDGGSQRFFIDGGFAQMLDNKLTLLTSQALEPSQIKPDQARRALQEARAMRITDDASFQARQNATRRAEEQLKLASTKP